MKRIFDIVFSFVGLLVISPILFVFIVLIYFQDFCSPFYFGLRVGRGGKIFRMVKLRSMVFNADKSGVDSTSVDDTRITWIGHLIRRYKLDEFSQLWNVLLGQMSLVGPRPNVKKDVDLYTREESRLLDVRPGITDFSSIVFSDEGDILAGSEEPDLKYNQIIRPWKSRLGLLYIQNRSFFLDAQIICLTVIAILSRNLALKGVHGIIRKLGVETQLLNVVMRKGALQPHPPPGSNQIVKSRNLKNN